MLTCSQCGRTAPDGTGFCAYCGNPFPAPVPPMEETVTCSNCGAEALEGAKFCNGCGTSLQAPAPKQCMSCGAELTSGSKFCSGCGVSTTTPTLIPNTYQTTPAPLAAAAPTPHTVTASTPGEKLSGEELKRLKCLKAIRFASVGNILIGTSIVAWVIATNPKTNDSKSPSWVLYLLLAEWLVLPWMAVSSHVKIKRCQYLIEGYRGWKFKGLAWLGIVYFLMSYTATFHDYHEDAHSGIIGVIIFFFRDGAVFGLTGMAGAVIDVWLVLAALGLLGMRISKDIDSPFSQP